jgi:uncharacterized membrane protein SpoIIM required for sporulation
VETWKPNYLNVDYLNVKKNEKKNTYLGLAVVVVVLVVIASVVEVGDTRGYNNSKKA